MPSNRPIGGTSEIDQIEDPGDVVIADVEGCVAVALELATERVDQPMQPALVQADSALQGIADHAGKRGGGRREQDEAAGRAGDQRG